MGGGASRVPHQNPSSTGSAGEGVLGRGRCDSEMGRKKTSGVARSCEGILLRPPGLGQSRKPKGDEKIKCVAFAREGLVLVATAGGVLWRVGFGKPHVASGQWEKVWEGSSPINCLTVVSREPFSPRATASHDSSSRGVASKTDNEGLVLLGLQNGKAVALWEDAQGGEISAEGGEGATPEMDLAADCVPVLRRGEISPEDGEWTDGGLAGGRTGHPRGCGESGEGPVLEAAKEAARKMQEQGQAAEEAGAEGAEAAVGWGGRGSLRHLEWEVDSGRPVLRVLAPGRPQCALVLTITTAKTLRLWALDRSSGGPGVKGRGR